LRRQRKEVVDKTLLRIGGQGLFRHRVWQLIQREELPRLPWSRSNVLLIWQRCRSRDEEE